MTSLIRTLRVFLLIAVGLQLANPASAATCASAPFVTAAGQAILRAARSGSPAALSSVASRYGDIHSLALFSLGPYRKQLPRAKEAEYVALTRGFIGRFLARNAKNIRATSLTVVSCTGSDDAPVVTTRLNNGSKAVFRLYRTRKGYMMRDVNIASVWLGAQLRSTFTGVIQRNRGEVGAIFAYLRG